jgi:uncharacterized protein (DUF58 family)
MRSRDSLHVLLYGDGIRSVEGRGAQQQVAFEEALADTRPAGATSALEAVESVADKLRPGRPVVLVTGAEADATVGDAMARLRQRGMRPFLLAPQLGQPPKPGEADTAALRQRQELLRDLRGKGYPVYEALEGMPLEDLFRIQGGA